MAPEKTNDPFIKLQSYTNFVLLKSGRLFQDSSKRGGQRMLVVRRELKKTLPGVLNSYHDVLDTFDTELQLARRALRKELAARQAQRKERERAEEEQKRKKAQPRPAPGPPMTAAKPVLSTNRGKAGDNDVIMLDGPAIGAARVGTQLYTDQGKPQETIAKSAPKPIGQDRKRAQPEAIKIPSPQPADATAAADLGQLSAGGIDDLFEGKTPTTANKDFDLDSIFNDIPAGPGDAMNVDTDTGDIDFTFPAETTDTSGGVSSLLPGLENYSDIGNDVNAGDSVNGTDFQFDIPAQENIASSAANNASALQATEAEQAPGTGDPNLDDLFSLDFSYSGEGGGLNGDSQFDDNFWGS